MRMELREAEYKKDNRDMSQFYSFTLLFLIYSRVANYKEMPRSKSVSFHSANVSFELYDSKGKAL